MFSYCQNYAVATPILMTAVGSISDIRHFFPYAAMNKVLSCIYQRADKAILNSTPPADGYIIRSGQSLMRRPEIKEVTVISNKIITLYSCKLKMNSLS